MIAVELACAVIVALWLGVRFFVEADRRALAVRLVCIALAAWLGEQSCIRLYGAYVYSSEWHVRLFDVPLAIVCIWPIVVQSALDLTRHVRGAKRVVLAAALVVVDASVIEPIATASGLWSWTDPGPFGVPLIGVLGWGYFALGVAAVVERRPLLALLAPVTGPLATHALLQVTWRGALRWVPPSEDARPYVAAAFVIALVVAVRLWRRPPPLALSDVLLRAPAAAFFFVLLALFGRGNPWLVAYALAFAPPWLALCAALATGRSNGASARPSTT